MQIVARWEGDGFIPIGRSQQYCDENMVIGQTYLVEVIEERSAKSHRHYFAVIGEVWANLPDGPNGLLMRFPTPEHLRAYALIKTGYATRSEHVCPSRAEAVRTALVAQQINPFIVAETMGNIVVIWRPKSQSVRAMGGAKAFQESKQAVLDYLAEMIGVSPEELSARAGQITGEKNEH